MRKLQQVVIVAAAVGSLVSIGAGSALANPLTEPLLGPAPQSGQQQVPQQQAPQQAPQGVAPQQQAPQQAPQGVAPQQQAAPQQAPQGPTTMNVYRTNNINRPAQECSPQTLVQLNVPVAILRSAETHGFSCTQNNSAFNRG